MFGKTLHGIRLLSVFMIVAGWLLMCVSPAQAQLALPGRAQQGPVYLITFKGAITPVLADYLGSTISTAIANNAEAVVLQLDTPGGSVDVTKTINQLILGSPVPVIVYVAPSGAQAGSAGTFITLAAHVAAMAPGTSIGAASPVDSSGQDIGETLAAKATNILSADIENLATRRGDAAVEWAIAAVTEARAATAAQALELGVIDFIAENVDVLLQRADGMSISMQDGNTRTLHTAGATVVEEQMGLVQRFLNFITNPTIATLLITLGTAGLLAEVWNPGTWVPGVIGGISLLLGLYALGQLDANFAGLALMGIGLALFIAEAFTPSFGALLVAGLIAFGLGALLLFNDTGYRVPWEAIVPTAVALGAFTFFISAKGLAAQRAPSPVGAASLIGMTGYAKEELLSGLPGSVFVNGEWWTATLDAGSVQAGESVRVVGRRGINLIVTRE